MRIKKVEILADLSTQLRIPDRFLRFSHFKYSLLNSIRWSILLIPLWYVLGLDQFVWPFMALFWAVQLFLQRGLTKRGIVLTKVARVGLLFVMVQIFSGLFIVEREFYIVYARNVLAWSGGLLLLIVLTNVITTKEQLFRLLWSWVYALLIAGLVGLIAFFWREGFEFKTLALYVVPQGMRSGVTAETVWTRSFLAEPVPIAGQIWYRVRSFFLYANSYAGVLVLAIPMFLYLLHRCRRFRLRWWLVFLTLSISLLNLIFTLSRAGILSLLIGMGLLLFMRTRHADRIVWVALIFLIMGAAFLTILTVSPEESVDTTVTVLEEFVSAKGRSHLTRFNVLTYTLISWRERPLFGWGTPREMSLYGFPKGYPRLGSHSQFLSVLYRTGIVGLFVYLWLQVRLWRRLQSYPTADWRLGLRAYLMWAFVANLTHSIFTQLDIGLIFLFFVWQLWGIMDVLPNLGPDKIVLEARVNSA